MTRTGVPVYLKDIAKVSDATEDFRSFTRINGNPGVRLRVTKQSGQNTVAIADAVRVEVARINNEIPGLRLHGARRQLGLHQAFDRVGAGSGGARRGAGRR